MAEAMKQAVIAGLGYTIMPLIGIKNALEINEIEIIPYQGLPIVTQWNLIWLKSKSLSPLATAFFQHIEEQRVTIANQFFGWTENY
jgi:DNA-binding transcriptional LysR family regulator